MSWPQDIVLLVLSLVLLGVTLALIRKHRLREGYAVLWVCSAVLALVFVMMPGTFAALGQWLGVGGAGLMALVGIIFLVGVALHFSVVLTRQWHREKRLAQEISFLKDELQKLRSEMREAPPPRAEPRPRPPSLRT